MSIIVLPICRRPAEALCAHAIAYVNGGHEHALGLPEEEVAEPTLCPTHRADELVVTLRRGPGFSVANGSASRVTGMPFDALVAGSGGGDARWCAGVAAAARGTGVGSACSADAGRGTVASAGCGTRAGGGASCGDGTGAAAGAGAGADV